MRISSRQASAQSVARVSRRFTAAICTLALAGSVLVATGPAVASDSATPPVVSDAAGLIAAAAHGGPITVSTKITLDGTPPTLRLIGSDDGSSVITLSGSGRLTVQGTVEISRVTIQGGSNVNGSGGAIDVARNANLTLLNSTVSGNIARNGGAINTASPSTLTIRDSTIENNTATSDGGGILNNGTLTIENSTINNNTATKKGGGLRDNGPNTRIVNSTFVANKASQGGALSVTGTTYVTHATIVRNSATSSSSAGIDRNGGTLRVSYSIIAENKRDDGSPANDCSGTPDLLDINFVSNLSGCNPAGNTTAPAGGLLLGELKDNGGPTKTVALGDFSPALDAIGLQSPADPARCLPATNTPAPGTTTSDQRGRARPTGPGCDVGAYERGQLDIDIALRVDTSNYQTAPYTDLTPPLPNGSVEVGVASVPNVKIAAELAKRTQVNEDGTIDAAGLRSIGLRSIGLRSIGLRSITLEDIGLRSIDVKANGLRSIGLRSIGLRSIGLRSIGLRSIGLRSIGLRSIPLSEIPLLDVGGWDALLADSKFAGVPLQSITLEDISVGCDVEGQPCLVPLTLTLQSIDLSSTGLRSIALQSILLSGIGLRSIPLPPQEGESAPADDDYASTWCLALFDQATCTDEFVQEVGGAELWEAQIAGGDVSQERVLEVPLSGLTAVGLRSIGLRSIGLRSIFLENTGLRSIGLRSIGLRSIDGASLETIIDCNAASNPCSEDLSNTLTLGDVAAGCISQDLLVQGATQPPNCLLRDDANVGQLLDLLGVKINGISLLDGLILYDILFAFVAPEDIPWEVVDLDGALLQNVGELPQPTFDYVTTVSVREGPADLDISLMLPQGFAVADAPNADAATWCPTDTTTVPPTMCSTAVLPTQPLALGNPKYRIEGVQSGDYELRIAVRAGLTVGDASQFPASVAVEGSGPNGTAPIATAGPVGVDVVEAASGGPGRSRLLSDDQLQLGHLSSRNDVDVYSFTPPINITGSSARVLLSNIPTGVDYDLSVYGPQPESLRGIPTRTLNTLGDVGFDLDPGDDVLSTDIANDIAIDINQIAAGLPGLGGGSIDYALRDISSRRSNNDEEVTVPALVGGQTYVVVVSGYLGDLSPEPYGLRIRLDTRNALPECAVNPAYPGPTASTAVVPVELGIGGGINTLYVTNGARLNAEFGGQLGAVVNAIAATDGVNGVDAGLLLVDELGEWADWNATPCDPDARNAIVRAIGGQIDAAGDSIENIVIVGGDGVIPMAAVPDLTEYSNESTFAREILSNGKSNALSGAAGAGYLLSDDPYATDAGIEILAGDHELYVPDRAIGRLVETAAEIIGQLDNFATYDGRLDPSTFNNTAAVTGYDFLDDGAQAIVDELEAAGFNVAELLQSTDADPNTDGTQLWDRAAFLRLLDGADYSIFSPNAHYDFESLLPAAADAGGSFTDADLVTASDVAGVAPAVSRSPVSSLIFTVGCHAGLSVSDVQLGLTGDNATLDWAQMYGANGNQFVAHTTYGYGDTEIVAYSERLAQLFASNVAAMTKGSLGASVSLGAAVRDAKQQYLASTLVLTPYDEKILQSWTYYGLPMYTLGALTPTTTSTAAFSATPLEVGALAGASTVTGPASFDFDQPTARGAIPVSIDLTGGALQLNKTDDGDYYSVDGNTIVAQYRPVQPLVDVPIPSSDPFGGFLITGMTSEDLPANYVPFVSRPLVDNSVDEGRIVAGDGAFPATLQRITDVGPEQRLLVAAGRYESNQRLFREITGELLPRIGTGDDQAPRLIEIVGRTISDVGLTGRGVQFNIVTGDDATRVVVVYREVGEPAWESIELAGQPPADGNRKWFGSAPLPSANAQVEFFAQSVDAAGNVGITSNKIENFLATDGTGSVDPQNGLEFVYAGLAAAQSEGRFFASGAKFEIQLGAVEVAQTTTKFSVDSGSLFEYDRTKDITLVFDKARAGEYDATNGTLYLDAGAHVLFAEDSTLQRVYRFFILDPTAPTVTFTTSATAASGDVDVTITARDTGAGVATLTHTCPAGPETCSVIEGFTTASDGTATLKIRSTGTVDTTISATSTDKVGNTTSATAPPTTAIDRTAPSVTIVADPAGWTKATVVNVTITATDNDGSGVKSIDTTCLPTVCTVVEPFAVDGNGTATLQLQVTAEGITTVGATATDKAGNTSSAASKTASIDRTAPTAGLLISGDTNSDGYYGAGETATITFSCRNVSGSDIAVSGVALCELLDGTKVVGSTTNGVATIYTVPGTQTGTKSFTVKATDNATNTRTTEVTSVSIDRTAPAAPSILVNPAGWTNATVVNVTIIATDPGGSGIRSINPTCPPTVCNVVEFTPAADGSATLKLTLQATEGITGITATATDQAGNTSPSANGTVSIDSTAPTASLTTSGAPLTRGVDSIAFSCGDALSGVATCQLFDGARLVAATPGTYPIPATSPVGTSKFTVVATDRAGNTFTSAPADVFIGYKICLNYNPNNAKNIGAAYGISITLCDPEAPTSGVTLTALTVDGTVDPGPGAPGGSNPAYVFTLERRGSYSYTIKTTGLSEGGHSLYFTAAPVDRIALTTPAQLQPLATYSAPFTLK